MESFHSKVANPIQKLTNLTLDVALLVGRIISVYSEQFPGQELKCRVLGANPKMLEIDSSGNAGLTSNLVNNQSLVLQFPYRGQEITVKAKLRKSDGGRCYLELEDKVTPLSQRQFQRMSTKCSVKLATYPITGSRVRKLTDLRWISTETVNISGGGTLVIIPSVLHVGVLTLLNIESEDIQLPKMILGHVRHCFQMENTQFLAGIEFVVKEIGMKLLSADHRAALPKAVFEYTVRNREKINRDIRSRMLADSKKSSIGENNEE